MKLWKKLLLGLVMIIIAGISVLTYMGYQQYQDATSQMSLTEKVEEITSDVAYVPYEELSPYLIEATIAVEDHRFYQHHGFDVIATTRALYNDLMGHGMLAGGSTITQQLAKNLYFGYHPSVVRKIAELFVVYELEHQYTKEEILALYVNVINYGDNHMGIYEASYGYFDVAPADLSLAQATLLAGLPQSPANYQLSDHYENAKYRQKQVLQAMVNENIITETEMEEAWEEPQ